MDFALSPEHREILACARKLATEFARRAPEHDRDATSPLENYIALRDAGFYGLVVPKELGGWGAGMLGYAIAAEALARGCASTALAFNMHCVAMFGLTALPVLGESRRRKIADLAVRDGKLVCALLSEPATTGLVYSTRAVTTRAKRVGEGWRITGRKAFASMVEASDMIVMFVHPETAGDPETALLAVFPSDTPGVRIESVWNTLGMRATRSDNVILENVFVDAEAVLAEAPFESLPRWVADNEASFNLPYTAVYLGVGGAALAAAIDAVTHRTPKGYAQPLAYHPDVRRRIATMSAELDGARWLLRRAAWLVDAGEDSPDATLAAYLRAKYAVGEAVARTSRSALELGGAHATFRGSTIERLFRDAATATIMQPSSDVCLAELSRIELGLDRDHIPPPLLAETTAKSGKE